MKKKKKLNREEAIALYSTYIPVRGEKITDWKEDAKGRVVLSFENKGVMNTLAQKLLKKPKTSYVHLDETGSFIWKQMDGKADVETIGKALKEAFGDKAEPLYDRLLKFFEVMESYDFLTWLKQKES